MLHDDDDGDGNRVKERKENVCEQRRPRKNVAIERLLFRSVLLCFWIEPRANETNSPGSVKLSGFRLSAVLSATKLTICSC